MNNKLGDLLGLQRAEGGCWPSSRQALLLHALIDAPATAEQSLQAWLRETDIEALDAGTFRLLPLLHKRYAGTPVEQQLDLRIKGVRRHAFYRSRLAASRHVPAVAALLQADLQPMLLKGAALACGYYDDASERPMEDLDLLIGRHEVERALQALAPLGWKPYNRAEYQISLRDPSGFEIDLHWHLIAESWFVPGFEQELLAASEPISWHGLPMTIPCPTDLLFHVLVHGLKWNVIPPMRWIVDAHGILARRGTAIDWCRLEELATRTAMLEVLDETLGYVAREFALPVPTAVLGRLHSHPRTPLAARELAIRIRRPGVLGFIPLAWLRHARRAGRSESVTTARGRIAYLIDCVGERSFGSALLAMIRKALRRVWRMTQGRA